MKKKLTILMGAGAVIEATNVSTNSITEDLKSDKLHTKSKELFSKISSELKENNKNCNDYSPNFEDIFHGLEILSSLYTQDNAAPEFKPMYKYFTNLKDKYKEFNPYKKHDIKLDITLSLAVTDLLNTIITNVESYNDASIPPWYKEFFEKLSDNYKLDIFNLNYDNWLEQIFVDNYNDGFIDSNTESPYLEFNQSEAINLENNININHLHGQINFTFVNCDIAQQHFGDNEFHTIYKIKNTNVTGAKPQREGNYKNSQGGEHIKQTTIITGKNKTEKIAIPPFDTYRANLQKATLTNSNLLIIGYGFNDLYINSLLKQFKKIHKNNAKVVVIDFFNENTWNNKMYWHNDNTNFNSEKYHTFFGLFDNNANNFDNNMHQKYKPKIEINNNYLYLTGFKDSAQNHINDILKYFN